MSGGFDPLHSGHLAYLRQAANYGSVIAIVNTTEWLKRKKGYEFMPIGQRVDLLDAIDCVHSVVVAKDSDGTVCETIKELHEMYSIKGFPMAFAKGGDRLPSNTPEFDLCMTLGIQMIFNCGGQKSESSSDLMKRAKENGAFC